MKTKYDLIDPDIANEDEVKVLIMYTGGTFGMMQTDIGYKPEPNYLLEKLLRSDDFYDFDYTKR